MSETKQNEKLDLDDVLDPLQSVDDAPIMGSPATVLQSKPKRNMKTKKSPSEAAEVFPSSPTLQGETPEETFRVEDMLTEAQKDDIWALLGPPTLKDPHAVRDPVDILVAYRDERGKTIVNDKILGALKKRFNAISEIATLPNTTELTNLSGIGDQTAVRIWRVSQQYHNINAKTAKSMVRQNDHIMKCSTGSEALDSLLDGGIATKSMTEFFGEAGMGKTQLCYTTAVLALVPKAEGGFTDFDPTSTDRPRVVWIDTEQTFAPARITEIVQNRFPNKKADDFLENIIVYQVMSTDLLLMAIKEIFQLPDNIVMIILDSLMALYRFEYSHGISELARRQQKLQEMIGVVKRNLVIRNTAMLVTNQATTKMQMIGPMSLTTIEAAGGFAVAHAVTHRIKLTKKSAGKDKTLVIRKATMVDSPYLSIGEAEFQLTSSGVMDIDKSLIKGKSAKAKDSFLEEEADEDEDDSLVV